jgi:hypothetical protein
MTSQSLSWIDRSRWSLLLENATPVGNASLRPLHKAALQVIDPSNAKLSKSSATGRFAVAQPSAPAPLKGDVSQSRPAPSAPVSSGSPAAALPAPFEPPKGALEERLQAFFEWVLRSVPPCIAAFIADEHGLPLVQRGAMLDYVAYSSSVLTLLSSIAALEGHEKRWLSIGITRDTILHLAEVTTTWGRFGVGIIANNSLRADLLGIVQQGLEGAFKE